MSTAVGSRPATAATEEAAPSQQPADVFVIFGITGDLAKVMTFNSLYRLEQRGLLDCPIVGVAVSDWSVQDLRDHARSAIENCGTKIDEKVFDRFAARLSYVSGDFDDEHIAHGVPSLALSMLPSRYAELLDRELPLEPDELARLRAFSPRFEQLCTELAAGGLPATVQHDDLHMGSVYQAGNHLRVLDWGDSSISHPFFSLVVTFRFLEERTGLRRHDRWFARLRDAYLEPWGNDFDELVDLAMRVGRFAHAIAWARQREFLTPPERTAFDEWFAHVLRRALHVT